MSFKVQTTYYAMVEDEFPKCLDALTKRLGRVEANLCEQKKASGDIVNRVLNSNGGSGTKRSENSEREAIQGNSRKLLLKIQMVLKRDHYTRKVE